jgi:hypothetical protein
LLLLLIPINNNQKRMSDCLRTIAATASEGQSLVVPGTGFNATSELLHVCDPPPYVVWCIVWEPELGRGRTPLAYPAYIQCQIEDAYQQWLREQKLAFAVELPGTSIRIDSVWEGQYKHFNVQKRVFFDVWRLQLPTREAVDALAIATHF